MNERTNKRTNELSTHADMVYRFRVRQESRLTLYSNILFYSRQLIIIFHSYINNILKRIRSLIQVTHFFFYEKYMHTIESHYHILDLTTAVCHHWRIHSLLRSLFLSFRHVLVVCSFI